MAIKLTRTISGTKKKETPYFIKARAAKRALVRAETASAQAGQGYQRPAFRGQDIHDGQHVSTDCRRLTSCVSPCRTLSLEEMRARCKELGLKSR